MTDTPEITAARAVLAEYDAPRCGFALPDRVPFLVSRCGLARGHAGDHEEFGRVIPGAANLRAVLAAHDEARAEVQAGIEANLHQTHVIGRERARRKQAEQERDALRALLGEAHGLATACAARLGGEVVVVTGEGA